MTPRPHTPAVLVVIDANSRLSVLQDAGVQIVLLDERVDPEFVTLLPQRNQYEEILLVLGEKYPVSLSDDHGSTAANAIAQLYRRRLIVGQLDPETTGPHPFPKTWTIESREEAINEALTR